MEWLWTALPALACGAMLLLVCVPMMRNMHKDSGGAEDPETRREISELRDEIARLKAERSLTDGSVRRDG